MENKCTLHNSIVLAVRMPKISKFGQDLTKFDEKKLDHSVAHPVYRVSGAVSKSLTKSSIDIMSMRRKPQATPKRCQIAILCLQIHANCT